MKIANPVSLLLFLSAIAPNPVEATPLCEYSFYSTPAVHRILTDELAVRGFAVVPAKYFAFTADPSESAVLSNGKFYAYLRFAKNVEMNGTSLIAQTASGDEIADAASYLYACSGGWCRSSEITTAIDAERPDFGHNALRISQEPMYGVRYSVYGRDLSVTSWRSQFDDRIAWITERLTDESSAIKLNAFSPTQKLLLGLASNPSALPFLNQISFRTDDRGRLVVSGRVPHEAYNLIIDTAISQGIYNIVPDIIIDSAAYPAPVWPDPELYRCLGW